MPHPTSAPLRLDAEGRLDIDLACVGCNYNLRMCDPDGRCPECGMAVGRSAVGHYLRFRDPGWVQCMAWGMNRFAVCIAMGLVFGGAVLTLYCTGVFDDLRTYLKVPMWLMVVVFGLIPSTAAAFGLLGFVRATRPEPQRPKPEPWWSWRKQARIAVWPAAAGVWFGLTHEADPRFAPRSYNYSMTAGGLAMTWVFVGLMMYSAYIMRLIPKPSLRRIAIVIAVCFAVSGTSWVALQYNPFGWLDVAVNLYEKISPTYTATQHVSSMSKLATGFFGLALLGVIPLFFLQWRAMRREAARARATWAATPFVKRRADDSPAAV